jgi:DNA replication ATP-dependent helicase Dna2
MNVSFTRARSKLVLFGSRKTLQEAAVLSEFFRLMDGRGWILSLPKKAHMLHPRLTKAVPSPRKRDRPTGEDKDATARAERPVKKAKGDITGASILRGRPVLKDLINGSL